VLERLCYIVTVSSVDAAQILRLELPISLLGYNKRK